VYRTVSLLVYTFGLAAFLGLFALWLRQLRLGRPELRGWLYPSIFLCSAAWFALNLLTFDYFLLLAGACLFPPLLGKLFGARGILFLALGSLVVAVLAILHQTELLPLAHARRDLSIAYCALFAWGCATAARRKPGGPINVALLITAMITVPVAMYTFSDWLSLVMRSLPLTILMVDSFSRRRFLFLDLFAKWGAYFAVALIALTVWFRLLPQSLNPIQAAVLLLPVMWGVPRLCRTLGETLDRRLLGRPYLPAEAQRLFLEKLQQADSVESIAAQAQLLFQEIFHTQATVTTDGTVQLEDRPDGRPLFSEDLALRDTLTEMLRFLLENRRLEARRRDLLLEASRSELKALRAQINPHFLFNALNTVAGLIPSNPMLAEETVVKLSDVFRYTLQRPEEERVPLSEELDFLRAWLDVEQARFGDRLKVAIEAAPETLSVRIPALALQTLVENALKHGVAKSSTPCQVTIHAAVHDNHLRLTITDTGPGPVDVATHEGHGLRNVRQRLAGYYGIAARLTLRRDDARGETIAQLELPL
jgi:signal transduction histidine kinase